MPSKTETSCLLFSQSDEIVFRELFSNYIVDVSKTKTVSKIDIITLLKTDKRVIHLVDDLKVRFPDEADSKLVSKVNASAYFHIEPLYYRAVLLVIQLSVTKCAYDVFID